MVEFKGKYYNPFTITMLELPEPFCIEPRYIRVLANNSERAIASIKVENESEYIEFANKCSQFMLDAFAAKGRSDSGSVSIPQLYDDVCQLFHTASDIRKELLRFMDDTNDSWCVCRIKDVLDEVSDMVNSTRTIMNRLHRELNNERVD